MAVPGQVRTGITRYGESGHGLGPGGSGRGDGAVTGGRRCVRGGRTGARCVSVGYIDILVAFPMGSVRALTIPRIRPTGRITRITTQMIDGLDGGEQRAGEIREADALRASSRAQSGERVSARYAQTFHQHSGRHTDCSGSLQRVGQLLQAQTQFAHFRLIRQRGTEDGNILQIRPTARQTRQGATCGSGACNGLVTAFGQNGERKRELG